MVGEDEFFQTDNDEIEADTDDGRNKNRGP
jgi:hypothetical protein